MKTGTVIYTLFLILFFSVAGASADDTKPVETIKKPAETIPWSKDIKKPADTEKPAEIKSHVGTVKSVQTSGPYTYLQLEEEGKEVWVATSPEYLKVNVSPGDRVEYRGGITMKDFDSKGLGKTFDTITLTSGITVLNKTMPVDDYHKKTPLTTDPLSPPKKGDIEKTKNGTTIEELFTKVEELKDREVKLRAKVMKVSKNVLKKNWLTLQDGTGTASDDKLVATTKEIVNTGEIIVVKGIVKTNVDLGGGYKYKVLLEDVTIEK